MGVAMPFERDVLDGIGAAFSASIDRDGSVWVVAALVVIGVILFFALVRWLVREVRMERAERAKLDARHEAALRAAAAVGQRREWLRVSAHLRLTLQRIDARGRIVFDDTETQNVSAGGVAFLAHDPPDLDTSLEFSLYLDEAWPLALRGRVTAVEAGDVPSAPSLVAVRLGPITEHRARALDRVGRPRACPPNRRLAPRPSLRALQETARRRHAGHARDLRRQGRRRLAIPIVAGLCHT